MQAVADALTRDQAQMEELVRMWTDREISTEEWRAARGPLEARISAGQRRLYAASGRPAAATLVGQGSQLRNDWPTLNLTRQAAIVKVTLDIVRVHPAAHRGSRDYLARVEPVWRR